MAKEVLGLSRVPLDTSAGLVVRDELPEPESSAEFLLGQFATVWQYGRPVATVCFAASTGGELPNVRVADLVTGGVRSAKLMDFHSVYIGVDVAAA